MSGFISRTSFFHSTNPSLDKISFCSEAKPDQVGVVASGLQISVWIAVFSWEPS